MSKLSSLETKALAEIGWNKNYSVLDLITETMNKFPSDYQLLYIETNAERLALDSLNAIVACDELLAGASAYESKCKTNESREYGLAYHVRSKTSTCKTSADKEAYSSYDVEYNQASTDYADAKMFRIYVEGKKNNLEKFHYMFKQISNKNNL